MGFTARLIAILALPVLLLAVLGTSIYSAMSDFLEQNRWVAHTFEVSHELVSSVAALRDAEAAQRAYALSGTSARLNDYYESLPRISEHMRKLMLLVADNAAQHDAAVRLEAAIAQRRDGMAAILASSMEKGVSATKGLPQVATSRQEDKAVDAIQDAMQAEEDRLLAQRRHASDLLANRTKSLTLGVIAVSFAMLGLALMITLREQRRRQAVEQQVTDSNWQLAHALEDAKSIGQSLQSLSDLAEMLQTCQTMDEAAAGFRVFAPRLLPRVSGAINLINSSQNLVESVVSWGQPHSHSESVFAPDECWALRRGQIYPENTATGAFACPHVHADRDGEPSPFYLCVPLLAQGQMLGTLFLSSTEAIGERTRNLAIAIAEHLSMSIANLRLRETLRNQSLKDALTGLFNRRYLEASLERELARSKRHGQPLSILMVDVDHFKQFNDKYGHEAGDVVLAQFAGLLSRSLRTEDVACRYGGEEFVVLLPETTAEAAYARATELCAATRALILEYRRQPLAPITISVGIAVYPQHASTQTNLMRIADSALYKAKSNGRDQVCFNNEPLPSEAPASNIVRLSDR